MGQVRDMGDQFEPWDPSETLAPVPRGMTCKTVAVDNVNGFGSQIVSIDDGNASAPYGRSGVVSVDFQD